MSEETRSIVPRKDGEAGIGREDKYWGKGYFGTVKVRDELVYKGKALSDALAEKDKNLSNEIDKVNKHFVTNEEAIATNATNIGKNTSNINANKESIAAVSKEVTTLKASVGTPLVAATVAAMTDNNKIYVYTGTESGYTEGNWYYNDGTKWVSGGVYNATALQTDTTLSVSGEAADSESVGKHLFPLHDTTRIVGEEFATGGNMKPNNRINSKRIHIVKNTKVHMLPNTKGYRFWTRAYKTGTNTIIPMTEIGGHDWSTEDAVFNNSCDIVVGMAKTGDEAFTSVDEMNGVFSLIEPVNEAINESVNILLNKVIDFSADKFEKLSVYFPLSLRRFATGGNGTPNNRIVVDRFKVNVGDFVYVSPKAYEYTFAFDLYEKDGTHIGGSSSLVEGSLPGGWLHDPYVFDRECYCMLWVAHSGIESDYIHNNAAFENLTDMDGKVIFIRKQQLDSEKDTESLTVNSEFIKTVEDAQYARASTVKPLTLLHFSDIHGDKDALNRILKDASSLKYDDAICTGDMAANTIDANFTQWWNPEILTCIGNHDCATIAQIDGKWVYTWDALSMADRDKTYIKPFESNWGITHTEGTSYYYKDYTDKRVRLIVLDNHLDNYESTKAEAAAQNEWLIAILESARLAGLHVLIATHYIIPNSKVRDCTFSPFGKTEVGSLVGDAHIHEDTVNTVAASIAKGLHFIGYISGHTHSDHILDAKGDGKQMQYNITCAAVSYAPQWDPEDLLRDETRDAFNMVVIDTEHTLVKLIRGGGADLDLFMRSRKAICINYSTGEICGEIK